MTALREPGPDLERLQGVVDLLHQRHAYYYQAGLLSEGTVVLSIVAPFPAESPRGSDADSFSLKTRVIQGGAIVMTLAKSKLGYA
ncbi:MAG: hypothetical protein ACO331_02590 [Prochlorothrix sp.]